jgi:hypothetical protein
MSRLQHKPPLSKQTREVASHMSVWKCCCLPNAPLVYFVEDYLRGFGERENSPNPSHPQTPWGLVWHQCFSRFCGVNSRPDLKTRKNPRGPFGRPVSAGQAPRKHSNTRRVEVEAKRPTPLAFLSLAARGARDDAQLLRRSKRKPLPTLPPTPADPPSHSQPTCSDVSHFFHIRRRRCRLRISPPAQLFLPRLLAGIPGCKYCLPHRLLSHVLLDAHEWPR